MRPFFGRIKRFRKSGGYCYLSAKLIDDEAFPFEDNAIVKLEVDQQNRKMTISIPEWWELLDWNKMSDAFQRLPSETKENIKKAGLVGRRS